MKELSVKLSKQTRFIGRNGYFKMDALDLYLTNGKIVILQPITSKGEIGRCSLEIPKEDLSAVICALAELANCK